MRRTTAPLPRPATPADWRPTPAMRRRRVAATAAALGLAVVVGLAAPAILAAARTARPGRGREDT